MTNQQKPQRAKTMLLIDAYNLIYRAYHASLIERKVTVEFQKELKSDEEINQAKEDLKAGKYTRVEQAFDDNWYAYGSEVQVIKESPTFTRKGLPNSAIYKVATMLKKLIRENPNPGYCLAVFDGGGDNFRKDLVDDYKGQRNEMPKELREQMPYIEQVFDLLGIPLYRPRGVEADDVIGALAKRAGDAGYKVDIISQDKDFHQLVTENVTVHNKTHDIAYNPDAVFKKHGVYPENIIGFLALTGDSIDNVAGVAKWGPGTAAKYLNKYGNLDNLIANASEITGVAGKNLKEAIDDGKLELYRKLVTLKLDVVVNLKNHEMTLKPTKEKEFDDFCVEFGTYNLMFDKLLDEELKEMKLRDKQELEKIRKSKSPSMSI